MPCPGYTPERDAPRRVTERLQRWGGSNPFGGPMWRLCLADHRYDLRAGIFNIMPSGKHVEFERGEDGRLIHHPVKPLKVVYGTMPVKKWPGVKGWILERWYPAHVWGARHWWESQVAKDGLTPILGEYPSRGDYWMQCGPWSKMPELDDIEQAISRYDWEMNNNPANMDMFMQSELNTLENEELAQYGRYEKELEAFCKSEISSVIKSTSLEASRVRQAAARAAGQTSHAGL